MEINKNANISDTQWFLYPNGYDSNINLLITDASKRILAATILGCTSSVSVRRKEPLRVHRKQPILVH